MMSDQILPTVPEGQASEPVLDIYSDIRSTMGVALVNLVWRHLAVEPTVLQWSWHLLKPLYRSNAIPTAAWLLRESLETPVLDEFTREEWDHSKTEFANAADLDMVLSTYERGNAQNLVAMCYLQRCLTDNALVSIKPLTLNPQQQAAEQADRVTGKVPPLPGWETLENDVKATINAMTEVWVPSGHDGFQPSVFRHIAYWPRILSLYKERLSSLQASSAESLSAMSRRATENAQRQVANIGNPPKNTSVLTTKDQQWLQTALDLFIHNMISPGVVIVPAMRMALSRAVEKYQPIKIDQ